MIAEIVAEKADDGLGARLGGGRGSGGGGCGSGRGRGIGPTGGHLGDSQEAVGEKSSGLIYENSVEDFQMAACQSFDQHGFGILNSPVTWQFLINR